ncbi:MAG: phosphopantothenoylcysteine decarboxylase, partial [Pseudanabaena sp.]
NTTMWLQPTVQENWQKLLKDSRYAAIAPTDGILACDAVGTGRMAEPKIILEYIESFLFTHGKQDLKGKKILVNAGGTREFIDSVRFIGNPSTGKQGIAIAKAAIHRGATVTLITTSNSPLPVGEVTPSVRVVSTSAEMHQAMIDEFPFADMT